MKTDQPLGNVFSRLISYIIDSLIISVLSTIILYLPWIVYKVEYTNISLFVGIFYFTYFFGKGATPGMNVLDLKLIKTSGEEPTYLTGFIRYLGMLISGILLLLGFIWILIDRNNQGWHDKIASTYVIKDVNDRN